jgi:hypothetical protein
MSFLLRKPRALPRPMIRVLDDLPENVLGVEAIGKVTDEDYDDATARAGA